MSGAQVYIVEYGDSNKLDVLKIDDIDERENFNKTYKIAQENNCQECIAGLIEHCEVIDGNNIRYVCHFELDGNEEKFLETAIYNRELALQEKV